jgi:hypothetical protein
MFRTPMIATDAPTDAELSGAKSERSGVWGTKILNPKSQIPTLAKSAQSVLNFRF